MRKTVVKYTELDKGRPKIAVSLSGTTHEEIIEQLKYALKYPCDIIEWRVDFFLAAIDDLEIKLRNDTVHSEIIRILDDIDFATDGKPLIFTIRSKSQGGRIQLDKKHVYDLTSLAAQSQLASLIDLELFDEGNMVDRERLIEQIEDIHSFGGKVILSYHDFKSMPRNDEIMRLVKAMRELGCDIAKIAAFAHSKKDAVNMIKCTQILTQGENDPVILIGMGKNGLVTRIFGGQYGSVITYATPGDPSSSNRAAHGQLDLQTVNRLLDEFYNKH